MLSGVRPEPDRVAAVDRLPVVLVAQRLEREKHTDVAVRAFAASGLADAGWRLKIAGDGALRGELEASRPRSGWATPWSSSATGGTCGS